MSKRDRIAMTPDERRALLADCRTMVLTSVGTDDYPHSVAMWFDFEDDETVWMATFGKSQKALNLRRNPKVALLVEDGTEYEELRGVLIRGDAEIIEDDEQTYQTLRRIFTRTYGELSEQVEEQLRLRAAKRVAIRVSPHRISSWDHRKVTDPH